MISVQEWAEIRRMRFVEGLAIREIRRRTGLHRETIRRALRSPEPPAYARPSRGSKLDPFKDEIHALLREDPGIESQRIRELLAEQGYAGGKTIADDYVREVRPFFVEQRTFQRTVYRPGDVAQFDLWQPKREIPVGYGQTRRGYVVVGALGFSRFGVGALVFSKQAPDVLSLRPSTPTAPPSRGSRRDADACTGRAGATTQLTLLGLAESDHRLGHHVRDPPRLWQLLPDVFT